MAKASQATQAFGALERGDKGALALFDGAIRRDPGDARLWLGKARALELNGDMKGARIVAQQISDQAPGYLEAHRLLAELRLAAGEADFASHFEAAAGKHPQDPNIPAAAIEALAALDHAKQAADLAARTRRRFPSEPHFALLEAIHAGSSGDWERADAIYATLDYSPAQRHLHEARHRLRGRQVDLAEILLTRVLSADPHDITAWALRGIAWRMSDNPQGRWLHEQAGLVRFLPLETRDDLVEEVAGHLRELHEHSSMPIGQSLRGGTQTRGILLSQPNPVLAELGQAIERTLQTYRSGLPSRDAQHPLLRHRDTGWQLAGSWSVRLSGGGDHHASHIHPGGIISSALYLSVPQELPENGEGKGSLELGRPPRDLHLDLEPLQRIQPVPGHLALFPSTLYHGTRPFAGSDAVERLTVAFDVRLDG